MANLIDFLLNNIFIVIIVIGFLLSLFRSAGKANRMPDFGGEGNGAGGNAEKKSVTPDARQPGSDRDRRYADRPETSFPVKTAAPESTVRYPIRYDLMTAPEKTVKTAEPAVRERRREAEERKPRQELPAGRSGEGLAEPGVQEAGAEEIRRAVVWAEILGPPRAKRPYRQ